MQRACTVLCRLFVHTPIQFALYGNHVCTVQQARPVLYTSADLAMFCSVHWPCRVPWPPSWRSGRSGVGWSQDLEMRAGWEKREQREQQDLGNQQDLGKQREQGKQRDSRATRKKQKRQEQQKRKEQDILKISDKSAKRLTELWPGQRRRAVVAMGAAWKEKNSYKGNKSNKREPEKQENQKYQKQQKDKKDIRKIQDKSGSGLIDGPLDRDG